MISQLFLHALPCCFIHLTIIWIKNPVTLITVTSIYNPTRRHRKFIDLFKEPFFMLHYYTRLKILTFFITPSIHVAETGGDFINRILLTPTVDIEVSIRTRVFICLIHLFPRLSMLHTANLFAWTSVVAKDMLLIE